MKKTHIQKLYDAINGGDDVDAAAEAQEISEALLDAIKKAKSYRLQTHHGDDKCLAILDSAIAKAEGKQ